MILGDSATFARCAVRMTEGLCMALNGHSTHTHAHYYTLQIEISVVRSKHPASILGNAILPALIESMLWKVNWYLYYLIKKIKKVFPRIGTLWF